MNYLAHLYLAGSQPESIVGNFIADHVKGSAIDTFSFGIKRGILMHRKIDEFTDLHPIVNQSVSRLQPIYKHYSSVIVDMFYDHFLSKYWHEYSSGVLAEFTAQKFQVLLEYQDIFPPKAKQILPYMIKQNWLMAYATFDGLDKALTGLARRAKFVSNMQYAVNDLEQNYKDYENEFRLYFPELIDFVKTNFQWISGK